MLWCCGCEGYLTLFFIIIISYGAKLRLFAAEYPLQKAGFPMCC